MKRPRLSSSKKLAVLVGIVVAGCSGSPPDSGTDAESEDALRRHHRDAGIPADAGLGSDGATPAPDASGAEGSGGGGGTATRPPYNTGSGFFVAGAKLYDPNGVEFRVRGVNKLHWDVDAPGIP